MGNITDEVLETYLNHHKDQPNGDENFYSGVAHFEWPFFNRLLPKPANSIRFFNPMDF